MVADDILSYGGGGGQNQWFLSESLYKKECSIAGCGSVLGSSEKLSYLLLNPPRTKFRVNQGVERLLNIQRLGFRPHWTGNRSEFLSTSLNPKTLYPNKILQP